MNAKQILLIKRLLIFIISFSVFFLMAFSVPPAFSAAVETISGKLSDGTPYAAYKPARWNGTIILDLDGATRMMNPPNGPKVAWLTRHGYAYGGTTRNIVGYDFRQAVDNLVAVRSIFAAEFEMPKRTLVQGISRGSFVARLAMEFEPEIFDGAITGAGGGAGEIATLNRLLDGLFVLKTLIDPQSAMQIVGVSNAKKAQNAETAALKELFAQAAANALGRARLTLAAAVEQFAPWTCMGSTEPASTDYDAQYEQLTCAFIGMPTFIFAHPVSVRTPLEKLAGGVVSWNHGVDYSKMLEISGRMDFVKAMYQKAGGGLEDDLRTLAEAPRISADPDAVGIAEKFSSYTGNIKGPVINVDNTGDPIDPISCEAAYSQTMQRSGNQDLLRNTMVHAPGHGNINALEIITGLVTLEERLASGRWPETTPAAMNARAKVLAAESPFLLRRLKAKFVEYQAGIPSRTWDVSNWDEYQPE